MSPSELVGLGPLMQRTEGRRDITVGLIDGPVSADHPAFLSQQIHRIDSSIRATCENPSSAACLHGTLVMGMLAAALAGEIHGVAIDVITGGVA